MSDKIEREGFGVVFVNGTMALQLGRQLTRPPKYYLTGYEGSKCEILDHADINFTPFKYQNIGAKYREICEGVDNEIRD